MEWMAESLTQAMQSADVAESVIYQAVVAHLGPERTVADVGAGVGRFAIPLATAGCRVWAVEPEPLMREYLARHRLEAGVTEDQMTVVPAPWPDAAVPAVEVAVSTYVIQAVADPVGFARALERVATRKVVMALHIDPMPLAELLTLFQPESPPPRLRFRELYPILLDGGILPDVRIVAEVQHPRFDTSAWAEQMTLRLGLQNDPTGQNRLRAWLAEKALDGTLSRPHRYALLTWTPTGDS